MKKVALTKKTFAIVDESDFNNIVKNYWTLAEGKRGRYAKRRVGPSDVVLMHRKMLPKFHGDFSRV